MSKPQRLGGRRTVSTTDNPTPPTVAEHEPATAGQQGRGQRLQAAPDPPAAPASAADSAGAGTRLPVRYEELTDVHVRMRDDQVGGLDQLRRRLVRESRRTRSADTPYERITANSLARVAVDYLLAHAEALEGHTEAELRRSLGLTE